MPPVEQPRKIPPGSLVAAIAIIAGAILAGVEAGRGAGELVRGELLPFFAGVLSFYIAALLGYRIFLALFPLQEGPVVEGPAAFAYCTYMLLNIFVFFPVLQSSFILPFPFRRPCYQLLGGRLGKNTHCPGVILDPPLVELGDNVVIGAESLFYAHAAEGELFVLARIKVANRATIGARAILMPGVTVGEGAVIAAGAVVSKGTQIGAGELWGGVPARLIRGGSG